MPKVDLNTLIEDVPVVTASEVISKRQIAIAGRLQEVDERLLAMVREAKELKLERAELLLEHDMLDKFDERSMIRLVSTTTTTVEVSGRMSSNDKMHFDDALKAIMLDAGRPLKFADIRNRLESYGIKWNRYASAYSYIVNLSGMLENAGAHGMFQLIRNK